LLQVFGLKPLDNGYRSKQLKKGGSSEQSLTRNRVINFKELISR
jgi:hypothetical protein